MARQIRVIKHSDSYKPVSTGFSIVPATEQAPVSERAIREAWMAELQLRREEREQLDRRIFFGAEMVEVH